jgi:phage baseplate assembly protein W
MAVLDTTKKPFVDDRNDSIFVGIDYPFHRSNGADGWFASTSTTIEAVKNNIRFLLSTEKGERLMQPNLGIGLRRFLFEQFNEDLVFELSNEILDTMRMWLPFVEVRDLQVSADDEGSVGKNRLTVNIMFNITRDPDSLESVQVNIGENNAVLE